MLLNKPRQSKVLHFAIVLIDENTSTLISSQIQKYFSLVYLLKVKLFTFTLTCVVDTNNQNIVFQACVFPMKDNCAAGQAFLSDGIYEEYPFHKTQRPYTIEYK